MRRITLVLILVIILSTYIWYPQKSKNTEVVVSQPATKEISNAPVRITVREGKRLESFNQEVADSDCKAAQQEILQLPLKEVFANLSLHPEQFQDKCFAVPNFSMNMQEYCFKGSELQPRCMIYLLNLKSALTNYLFDDSVDPKTLETNVIAHKIFAKLKESRAENADILEKLGDEYIQRFPNDDMEALKTYIITQKMSDQAFQENGKLYPYVQRGLQFDPNDPDFLELYFYGLSRAPNGIGLLQNYIAQNPQRSLAYYFLAMAYWQNKDRDHAVLSLKQAIKVDSSKERYGISLTKVMNPGIKPGDNSVFYFEIASQIVSE